MTQLVLRDYQVTAVKWLRERRRAILADVMGLGKTVTAISAMETPALIIAPASAIGVWQDECEVWADFEPIDLSTSKVKRNLLYDQIHASGFDGIVLSSYAKTKELLGRRSRWNTIIYDEAHILRNRSAPTLYKTVKELRTNYLFHLTATPIVNGAQDLWTLLNLLDSRKYRSYWNFVNQYCHVYDSEYGGKTVEGIRNARVLRKNLEDTMLRRTYTDVGRELPPLQRQRVRTQLTPKQRKVYDALYNELAVILPEDGFALHAPNTLAVTTRLRQLLVHPALIGLDSRSAALDTLSEELSGTDQPVVIFMPFAEAFPYYQEALEKLGFQVSTIRGGMSPSKIRQAKEQFAKGKKQALIATLQMATSWSATVAHVAYVVGFDWLATTHTQAEGRLHRDGQDHPVVVRYITHENTIDQHVLDIVNNKYSWAQVVYEAMKR